MKYKIVTFGKIKSEPVNQLIEYYAQLLSKYAEIEWETRKDPNRKIKLEDFPDQDTNYFEIALTEDGEQFPTTEFAQKLQNFKNNSEKLAFVIANAWGFEQEVFTDIDMKLSLGKFTYPHELSICMLIEQLYRCENILAGGNYHK